MDIRVVPDENYDDMKMDKLGREYKLAAVFCRFRYFMESRIFYSIPQLQFYSRLEETFVSPTLMTKAVWCASMLLGTLLSCVGAKTGSASEFANVTLDWRLSGAVTGVSDQGNCDSSYAFAALSTLESASYILSTKKKLVKLSYQEVVSCMYSSCLPQAISTTFEWILNARWGAVIADASFKYESFDGQVPRCSSIPANATVGASMSSFYSIPSDDAAMVKHLQHTGPFGIAVDATSWETYLDGIILGSRCISVTASHFAVVVGVDEGYAVPYWVVKNSWGVSWGEEGYVRLEMGQNTCLMNSSPMGVVAAV